MYAIKCTSASQKQLQNLSVDIQQKILQKINYHSVNPRLSSYIKLPGRAGYRIRFGVAELFTKSMTND